MCVLSTDVSPLEHDELEALRSKLRQAEQARIAGALVYTPEESRKQLEEIYKNNTASAL